MANVATLGARAAFDVSAFQSGTQKMLQGLSQIKAAVNSASGTLQKTGQDSDKFGGTLYGLKGAFSQAAIGGIAFAGAMTTINAATGLVHRSLSALVGGLKWGAELAMQAEQASVSFEVMLGSAKKAKVMMRDIEAFALATPFDVGGVTEGVKMLSGMGIAEKDLLPAMKTLGDMSLGNRDKLMGLALAFGQVQAKGKLMAQEFNQFAERGINLRETLASNLKIPVSEVAKAMEDGKISADIFRNALIDLANTKFSGMMERNLGTIQGQLDKLRENAGGIFKDIATGLGEAFGAKDILSTMNGMLEHVRDVIRESMGMLRTAKALLPGGGKMSFMNSLSVGMQTARDMLPSRNTINAGAGILDALGMPMIGGAIRAGQAGGAAGGLALKPVFDLAKLANERAIANKKEAIKPQGLEKVVPGLNLFKELGTPLISGVQDAMSRAGGMLSGGLFNFGMSVRDTTAGMYKALEPSKAPEAYMPTRGLQAGSSEAFSAIIKNMFSGKKETREEKSYETLRGILKGINKMADTLSKDGTTLITIPDFGLGG